MRVNTVLKLFTVAAAHSFVRVDAVVRSFKGFEIEHNVNGKYSYYRVITNEHGEATMTFDRWFEFAQKQNNNIKQQLFQPLHPVQNGWNHDLHGRYRRQFDDIGRLISDHFECLKTEKRRLWFRQISAVHRRNLLGNWLRKLLTNRFFGDTTQCRF